MQIVPPSRKARELLVTTRPKALLFSALSVIWVLFSIGAAAFDLSTEFHSWPAIRVGVWVMQGVLLIAAAGFWRFERPRQVKLQGWIPKPPVIHCVDVHPVKPSPPGDR